MSDIIKSMTIDVESLEKNFELLDKDNKESSESLKDGVLELLASLKHNQDEPENEADEDDFEDLIYRVILILGQL
jgi:hypothetical protein